MSSKRTLGDAEDAPNTKRQQSVLDIIFETEEELRTNKRKVDTLELIDHETEPQKSPKKSTERVPRFEASKVEDLTFEGVSSSSNIATTTAASAVVTVEKPLSPKQSRAAIPEFGRTPVVVPKILKVVVNRIESSSEDDVIKPSTSGITVALPHMPRPIPTVVPITSQVTPAEDNNISIPVSDISVIYQGDEVIRLWNQFYIAMDTCLSTVAPIFLVVILVLYAVSAVTKSQTIASIALVYVFVFLTIMFSYFFAIVPFILISNAISSIVTPEGKSSQRDLVRVTVLVAIITVFTGCLKYGPALF